MENMSQTPPKMESQCKTIPTPPLPLPPPPPVDHHQLPSNELRKPVTPYHLKLPKPFKYLERYTSPTDMMMSPVTKGLLAINKKGGALLPPGPGKYQPKVPDMCLQDLSPLQNKLPMLIDEKLNST
ncbi:uncharacterized protein [Medicago truncatula]|uniref:uncharacterized protein isoform X1 n=1 Tax=Medicago truncatula TaxID=3880 RepID=UPI001967CD82|nr:uncharacterized protein LOC11422532 isoform X1 [Medicago truncatula]